jgi:hypothetical protein
MEPFEVEWAAEAEDELAVWWLAAGDRPALTLATELADRHLARNPHHYGVALAEGLWAMTVPPLRIYYRISDADHRVEVTNVRRIG